MSNLRWLVKAPGKPVEERIFEVSYKDDDDRAIKELKLAQELVKGYVEIVWIGSSDVKVMVNEEGMYEPNMECNCGFLGNIVFFREVVEQDEVWWGSLTDDDVRKIKVWTIAHAHDMHPGNVSNIYTGKDIDTYRKLLHEDQKVQQSEWESF